MKYKYERYSACTVFYFLLINSVIMAIKITKAGSSDLSAANSITTGLQGKIFGDKGYISKIYSKSIFLVYAYLQGYVKI